MVHLEDEFRKMFVSDRTNKTLEDLHLNLIDVYNEPESFTRQQLDPEEVNFHRNFRQFQR